MFILSKSMKKYLVKPTRIIDEKGYIQTIDDYLENVPTGGSGSGSGNCLLNNVTIHPYQSLSKPAEEAMNIDRNKTLTQTANQMFDTIGKLAYATASELQFVVDPRIQALESDKTVTDNLLNDLSSEIDMVKKTAVNAETQAVEAKSETDSLFQNYNNLNTRVETLENLDGSESIKVGPQLMGSEAMNTHVVTWHDTNGAEETRSLTYGPTASLDQVIDWIHEPLAAGINAHEARITTLENNSGSASGDISNATVTFTVHETTDSGIIEVERTKIMNEIISQFDLGMLQIVVVMEKIKLPNLYQNPVSIDVINSAKNMYNKYEYTMPSILESYSIPELLQTLNNNDLQNQNVINSNLTRITTMEQQITTNTEAIASNTSNIATLRNDVDAIQIQADAVQDISYKKVTFTNSTFDEASGTTQTSDKNDEIKDVLTEMSADIASAKNISNRTVSYYTSGGSRQSDTLANHIKNLNTKTSSNATSITSLENRMTDVETQLTGVKVTCNCDAESTNNKITALTTAFNNLKQAVLDDLDYIWTQLRAIHTDLPDIRPDPSGNGDTTMYWNVADVTIQ